MADQRPRGQVARRWRAEDSFSVDGWTADVGTQQLPEAGRRLMNRQPTNRSKRLPPSAAEAPTCTPSTDGPAPARASGTPGTRASWALPLAPDPSAGSPAG